MSRRHYVDNAPTCTLASPAGSTDTTITLSSATGLPATFPYTGTLDLGLSTAENVMVTAAAGAVLTVTRNIDSLGAFSHITGSNFNHTSVALDYDEANSHVNASTGVHGITGAVVGTTDTQTLSNKTFGGLALTANSGVIGLTVTGDGAGDAIDFKVSGSTLFKVDGSGNTSGKVATVTGVTNSGNETVGGTLGVTGVTTLGTAHITTNTVSGNETVAGTLVVTGLTTLTGGLAAAAVTGNATVGGTLGVTGTTTTAAISATNVTASGTLAVSGTATMAQVNATEVAGRIVPPQYTNEAARDAAITSPAAGECISLTAPTTGSQAFREEIYNGAAWVPTAGGWVTYTPTLTNMAIGNGTVTGRFCLIGKALHLRWVINYGTTTTVSGQVSVSLPTGFTTINDFEQQMHLDIEVASSQYVGTARIPANATAFNALGIPTAANNCALTAYSALLSFVSGNFIVGQGTLQVQ